MLIFKTFFLKNDNQGFYHGFIASEFEDAVRRNGGRVLGPAARVSEALALIEAAPCDAALLDITLEYGETVYPVASSA